MKRLSLLLLIVACLVWVCGCSKKERPEVKSPTVDQSEEEQPQEPEIKGATPEDPGAVTVVGPLEVWKKQAELARAQRQRAVPQEPQAIDHPVVVLINAEKPKNFLHRIFSVNDHAQFAFLVPPHQENTRLHGSFRSFTNRNDPNSSDRSADVDVLLLNDQEFNQFLHGQPQSVTYELDSGHNEVVDWRVPTTHADPQTYHLVFSNSGSGAKTKFVEADFTVSF